MGWVLCRSISFAVSVLPIVACSKRSPPQQDGTQHTGGGTVTQSSATEVNRALDRAIALAVEPDWSKNIFAQFVSDRAMSTGKAWYKSPHHIFPNDRSKSSPEVAYQSPMLQAFKTNAIDRLQIGSCPGPGGSHADASVSELNPRARICFSIGNLTRLPPSTLLREILALLLHEASHMGGAEEADARTWQKEFAEYFGSRFGDVTVDDFTYQTNVNLRGAQRRVALAKSVAERSAESKYIFAEMGNVVGLLNSIPHVDDPLAIELKARIKHPELIENFWIALNLLIQKISAAFQTPSDYRTFTLVPYPGHMIETDKVLEALKDYEAGLSCLRENFEAFSNGLLRKECKMKPMTALEKVFLLPRDNGH